MEQGQHKPEQATQLALTHLYTSASHWLWENLVLYVDPDDLVNEKPCFYNDVLVAETPPEYSIAIAGELVLQLEPDAARELALTPDDQLVMTYDSAHFSAEDDIPGLYYYTEGACRFDIVQPKIRDGDPVECRIDASDSGEIKADWTDHRVTDYASSRTMTMQHCHGLQAIVDHLDAFRQAMIDRGEFPADDAELLSWHKDRVMSEEIARVVLDTEAEVHRAEVQFAKTTERIQDAAAEEARQATEARLSNVPVVGPIDQEIAQIMQASCDKRVHHDRTFAGISRKEVEMLRTTIAEKLLEHDRALYLFTEDDVLRVSPAFHDARTARATTTSTIGLKSESGPHGPFFTFTVTKEILGTDGVQKSLVESFIFHKDAYLKTRTTIHADIGTSMSIVQGQDPLTRTQRDVFSWLLDGIMPLRAQ